MWLECPHPPAPPELLPTIRSLDMGFIRRFSLPP
jgi:hypothetical protein